MFCANQSSQIVAFLSTPSFLSLCYQPILVTLNSLRGYFITGEKDYSLERAREIQKMLKENHIQFGEEVHSDLGHEFPPDFEKSFDNAIKFIFKEHE